MVRNLRANLDQYQDPYVQAQIRKMLAEGAPSNSVQGFASVFKKGLAGVMGGADTKQRQEAQKTYATAMATPYSPAQTAVPYSDFNASELEGEEGPDMEFYSDGTSKEIPSLPEGGNIIEAKEEDGPFIAAQRELNKFEDNPYATGLSAQIGYDKANMERNLAGKLRLAQQKKELGINASGRAASGIQYYDRMDELIRKFGVNSPQVKRMENIIKTVKFQDIGGAIKPFNPMRPKEQIPVTLKTLKPGDVPLNAAQKAQATSGGTKIGTKNAEDYAIVKTAVDQQEDIARLITQLNSSEAITGIGAEMLKNLARVKAFIGDKVARKKASDTEILDVMMGSEVFPMIKSLGIGARGMDTPAEREFMRKVLTGSLELDRTTLIKMAEMRSNIARRRISKWNASIDSGELNSFYTNQKLPKNKFKIIGAGNPDPFGLFVK